MTPPRVPPTPGRVSSSDESPGGAPVATTRVPLGVLAHARSGDKGNHANIAVIAHTDAGFAWLRARLTREAVAEHFAPLGPTRVERYEAANVRGLNFVLENVLAGGASRSLRSDTQGKALAVALLLKVIEVPVAFGDMVRPEPGPAPGGEGG